MPLSIKKVKKNDFPDELSKEDIICDITNSDPNDILFQQFDHLTGSSLKAHSGQTGSQAEFKALCSKIDEINRANQLYDETFEILKNLKNDKNEIFTNLPSY